MLFAGVPEGNSDASVGTFGRTLVTVVDPDLER